MLNKEWMRRGVVALLGAVAILTASERPAHAGRVFLFAESATCSALSSNCSKAYVSNAPDIYAYVAGTDNILTASNWPFAIPPDAAASTAFTFKVHYETPDTGASKVCSFNVQAIAFPSGAPIDGYTGSPTAAVTATSSSATHVATDRYITSASSSYSVWNNLTGASCASSACLNTSASLIVSIDTTGTTATSCRARMIEVIY